MGFGDEIGLAQGPTVGGDSLGSTQAQLWFFPHQIIPWNILEQADRDCPRIQFFPLYFLRIRFSCLKVMERRSRDSGRGRGLSTPHRGRAPIPAGPSETALTFLQDLQAAQLAVVGRLMQRQPALLVGLCQILPVLDHDLQGFFIPFLDGLQDGIHSPVGASGRRRQRLGQASCFLRVGANACPGVPHSWVLVYSGTNVSALQLSRCKRTGVVLQPCGFLWLKLMSHPDYSYQADLGTEADSCGRVGSNQGPFPKMDLCLVPSTATYRAE